MRIFALFQFDHFLNSLRRKIVICLPSPLRIVLLADVTDYHLPSEDVRAW
jgi:hypothetical protein